MFLTIFTLLVIIQLNQFYYIFSIAAGRGDSFREIFEKDKQFLKRFLEST